MNVYEALGKKLQARRVEKGYATQTALANELNIDPSRVSLWESGDNFPPDPKYRKKLSEVLEVDEEFFETLDPSPGPESRESLLGAIVIAISTLNNSELQEVLSHAQSSASFIQSQKLTVK